MLYLDTSVLVSLLVREVHSAQTLGWFALQIDQHLVISDFVSSSSPAHCAGKWAPGACQKTMLHEQN